MAASLPCSRPMAHDVATYLIHRGSPQSRDTDDEMAEDTKAIRRKLDA
ncbi:MAG TPA: hypothetical protein VJQ79_02565 [Acidimicrobiia bacterium]|nr:hypothetical protein [Acidimicrobiia bacterium]